MNLLSIQPDANCVITTYKQWNILLCALRVDIDITISNMVINPLGDAQKAVEHICQIIITLVRQQTFDPCRTIRNPNDGIFHSATCCHN